MTGLQQGVLSVRVTAPPVDGAANEACRTLLAEWLGVRRSDVALESGAHSRDKRFRVNSLDEAELAARIASRIGRATPG